MITTASQSRFHALLFVTIVLLSISFTRTADAASTGSSGVARTKCTSVKQEVVDFKTLETKIRNTNAIGGFAKLRLSSDIKQMLADLKSYQAGESSLTLEQHREQYDLLYMKIVSQVQEKDPELHQQLCNAWDPIWTELQDEKNLKKVTQLQLIEARAMAMMAGVFMPVMNVVIPPANAHEKLTHGEVVKRDLLVVVAAQGILCTAITLYEKITNHDYVATCKSGDKYRVHVSADGRVNVAPHQ
jgi:hypothetical protein